MTNPTILPQHPKLKTPPVTGVSFEMTFTAARSAAEALPILGDRLNEIFPRAAQRWVHRLDEVDPKPEPTLPEIQVSKVEPPADQPQFKLYDREDGNALLFGTSFFKVVYIEDYSGWIEFSALLKNLLSAHKEAADVTGYSSFKLMYANRVPWEEGREEEVLQKWALPSTPPLPELESIVIRQQSLTVQFPDGFQDILVSAPGLEEASDELVIQFDIIHSIAFDVPQIADPESILEWTDGAHERIYQTFHNILTPEFLEVIS